MRIPLIAGNWKMNKKPSEAKEFIELLKEGLGIKVNVEVCVCPPFTALPAVAWMLRDSNIKLGAQNMHWERHGAFTGEISGEFLVDLGCQYVILGHSERRQYFAETDEIINKKILTALSLNLCPIFCVGESLAEREANQTFDVIKKQIETGLANIANITESVEKSTSESVTNEPKDTEDETRLSTPDTTGVKNQIVKNPLTNLVIAYEPVWAIGTGKNATPEQAQEVHAFIREMIVQKFGKDIANDLRIIYGGSVSPENIDSLMAQDQIDGVLVGGASLKLESFLRIINYRSF